MHPSPGLDAARFRGAITAVLLIVLLGALDQSVVGVAIPSIARELGGLAWMPWVVSGYLIAATVGALAYGRLSDLYGPCNVTSAALLVFLIGSVACALAPSVPLLVIARFVQGAGAGGLIVMAQTIVAHLVPRHERGKFLGYVSMVYAGASGVGPLLSGVLSEFLSWQAIYWINVPLCIAALVLIRRSLSVAPSARPDTRLRWSGMPTLLSGLCALLIPISRLGQGVPLAEAGNALLLTGAAVLLCRFWRQQQAPDTALFPMSVLLDKVVMVCCALLFICFFVFVALCALIPLRLQLIANYPASRAALDILGLTLAIPLAVFGAGRWIARGAPIRPLQRIGVLLVPAALLALACFSAQDRLINIVATLVLGIGLGLQIPATTLSAQSAVPANVLGMVTALTVFSRLLGGAIGVAVLCSLLMALLHRAMPSALLSMAALMDHARAAAPDSHRLDIAFRLTFLVAAGISLLSVYLARHLPDLRFGTQPAPNHGAGGAVAGAR
jgi:MFS family permease